ncbi:MAG: DUF721 domain-containing protein [Proteobacteria bacterium]|nr:DUF721 domain-containing protein [Pseudomonadota bacterium]
MSKKANRNITTLLGDLPVSRKLKSSSKIVSPIADNWLELIEQPLSAHSLPSHFEDETLTVAVDGSVWATELRHNIPSILRKLHILGHNQVLKIKIILQPENIGPNRQKRTIRQTVDADALKGIAHSAQHVKEEILAKALKSLAKTLNGEHK